MEIENQRTVNVFSAYVPSVSPKEIDRKEINNHTSMTNRRILPLPTECICEAEKENKEKQLIASHPIFNEI